MRFIESEIEEKCVCAHKKVEEELMTFMRMNIKTAKVIYTEDEYSCPTGARVSLSRGAKMYRLPIEVKLVNGNVYLVRTDL